MKTKHPYTKNKIKHLNKKLKLLLLSSIPALAELPGEKNNIQYPAIQPKYNVVTIGFKTILFFIKTTIYNVKIIIIPALIFSMPQPAIIPNISAGNIHNIHLKHCPFSKLYFLNTNNTIRSKTAGYK